jgi:hypothetical protein
MTDILPPDDDDNCSDNPQEPGRRKDGKPFKDGNTRDDGSYGVGKYRPPKNGQFQKNDGRKRGKRKKGSKNLATIWAKKLSQKIKYEGKEQTAAEWLVEGMIRRGISRSDRAAETALGEAGRLEGERERHLGKTDTEIIETWLAQRLSEAANDISDDEDNEQISNGDSEEDNNADQ